MLPGPKRLKYMLVAAEIASIFSKIASSLIFAVCQWQTAQITYPPPLEKSLLYTCLTLVSRITQVKAAEVLKCGPRALHYLEAESTIPSMAGRAVIMNQAARFSVTIGLYCYYTTTTSTTILVRWYGRVSYWARWVWREFRLTRLCSRRDRRRRPRHWTEHWRSLEPDCPPAEIYTALQYSSQAEKHSSTENYLSFLLQQRYSSL